MAKIDGFYNNAMLLVASQYAYEKSVQLGVPLILNNITHIIIKIKYDIITIIIDFFKIITNRIKRSKIFPII